jgi:hypothetical protein
MTLNVVRLLDRKWMPCWELVLNLILNDIIEQVTPSVKPMLDLVKLTSSPSKWASLVQDLHEVSGEKRTKAQEKQAAKRRNGGESPKKKEK